MHNYVLYIAVSFTANKMIPQLSDFFKSNYIKSRYYSQEGIWQLLHPKHFDNALSIHHLEGQREKEISNVAALLNEGLAECNNQLPSPDNVETESDGSVRSHNIADAFKPFDKHISGAPGMGKQYFVKKWLISGQKSIS